jgi:hypothetical protein
MNAGLCRRLARVTEATRERVWRRQDVREKAQALAVIRAALARAGIDPAQCSGIRYFAGADAALARLDDSPERQLADAEFIIADRVLSGRARLTETAAQRSTRFSADDPPLQASPLDCYAWALAAGAAG